MLMGRELISKSLILMKYYFEDEIDCRPWVMISEFLQFDIIKILTLRRNTNQCSVDLTE